MKTCVWDLGHSNIRPQCFYCRCTEYIADINIYGVRECGNQTQLDRGGSPHNWVCRVIGRYDCTLCGKREKALVDSNCIAFRSLWPTKASSGGLSAPGPYAHTPPSQTNNCDWVADSAKNRYLCKHCADSITFTAAARMSALPKNPCPALVAPAVSYAGVVQNALLTPPSASAQPPARCSLRLTGKNRQRTNQWGVTVHEDEHECTVCLTTGWASGVFTIPPCKGPAASGRPVPPTGLSGSAKSLLEFAAPVSWPTPKAKPKTYPLCKTCQRELSPTLDAYYGTDPILKDRCVDCREGKFGRLVALGVKT